MEAIMRSFAGAILVIMALQSGALAQSPPEPAPPGTAVPRKIPSKLGTNLPTTNLHARDFPAQLLLKENRSSIISPYSVAPVN